jgi:flagellar motor switch protein FliN/FliY
MEQRQAQPQTTPPPKAAAAPAAGFAELKADGKDAGKAQDMDFLLDIPLEVTVELGRSRMIIKDLLQLGQGSVLELEKVAGEPMDILVNNKLVARGEVVVVNEKFGIRLTDIISPTERIRQLK